MKLAVAGFGLVGRRHVTAMAQSGNADIWGVVEPSPQGATEARAQGLSCFDTLAACLTQPEKPDGIILATPTPLHLEQTLACIEAGIPVLVEKPIAASAEDGKSIMEASDRSGVPVLVGHHRRHNPLIAKAKEVISRGNLGPVRSLHATCWFHKPDHYFEEALWRTKPGAGPILVNLVHDVDLMRHLVGEVTTVQSLARPSARGHDNEDVASALLGFANGAVGTMTVSDAIASPWSWEMTSREYPIYPVTPEACYMVGGTKASLSIPDLRVWAHSGEPDWWSPIAATSLVRSAEDPLVAQIRHFARVIEEGEEPLVSAREGYETLRVIEAIQQAAETGGLIEL